MAASPIEAFIRSHEGESFEAALEAFLDTPKIRAWVGSDESRVTRLRDEFHRSWVRVNGDAGEPDDDPRTRPTDARGGSAATEVLEPRPTPPRASPERSPTPAQQPMRQVPVQGRKDATKPSKPAPQPSVDLPGKGMRLPAARSVMCPACYSLDLHAHLQGDVVKVRCARCRAVYGDLLECIPVRELGPFAYLFGEGWRGVMNALLLALFLAATYGVLKWAL